MSLIINKFGGGIMSSAKAIRHLPKTFEKHIHGNSMNVFSAFGKTTNNLEKILHNYASGDTNESSKIMHELKAFHLEIARDLFPEGHVTFGIIEDLFKKMQERLYLIGRGEDKKFIYDQIVPYGEILSSLVASEYLSHVGIKNKLVHATDFLKTDSNFNIANVDKKATNENLKVQIKEEIFITHKNIVTEGFIGFCEEGMTTLGREGSDYTAGILGNLMNASKVVLWKDVPGVMDKNPKLAGNENVQKIDFITYDDFEKHLEFNAVGLVHPKTLREVKEKKIPLQVRPFWDLESEGTLIHI
ncbi:hypothetical protein A2W67_03005 [Candidatus Nomurabacteria bacterium RIFCSPLOWO2_02_40_28]|uniref:Aspartokinase n=2 Tax=Candidatus Nomuraibacteriota TaxID=1752729 RepID=A0A837HX97_9BACT|nr:MAG: Aspartokinase [Candidatus Nomurabacteria bacterium GW2011_GWD2_39_12]KKR21018.1 MAG: Aspartokinase [Candidatus Nomurabacteria bacterium GW2011_GWC2_39_41]KKR37021.1 MAG: Aspartokinase [Candidatus Nomurabacteria bacterium GW2011_GWE2_40_10]KKR38967.1 MAG: Aspartokinase [Candidatus Nomurabacteria bacterium GW2011_GWB1_40_11]KKR40209.1 MAG: Aspartokinase [Parcubacteria group bacterium GW2011_GWC1_40_11]KKR59354.1 MAG: Aspartokinase [Candidatus Nomurabacteria bacterium GW2011_GWF2_40_31]K